MQPLNNLMQHMRRLNLPHNKGSALLSKPASCNMTTLASRPYSTTNTMCTRYNEPCSSPIPIPAHNNSFVEILHCKGRCPMEARRTYDDTEVPALKPANSSIRRETPPLPQTHSYIATSTSGIAPPLITISPH